MAFVEADAPRVACPEHGPTVIQVPWARHDAGHTRAFDDQIAWLAVHTSKTAVCEPTRIAWRTVGAIVARVVDEARAARDTKTLERFFDLLGHDRCAEIRFVSADGADWIHDLVHTRCPNASICLDAFHVVRWTTDALDVVRRNVWNLARSLGATGLARGLKKARFALWKNPENLIARQHAKLPRIKRLNAPLYRAYLLKEQLRAIFTIEGNEPSGPSTRGWPWAQRSRLPSFVELARRIRKHRAGIEAAVTHDLSNALVESTNTKLRLLTRQAYGFKNPEALIALALPDRGGYRPDLPGRTA